MDPDGVRGRTLVEQSREAVVVVDDADRVILASRRARQAIEDLTEGEPLPEDLLAGGRGLIPFGLNIVYNMRYLIPALPFAAVAIAAQLQLLVFLIFHDACRLLGGLAT